MLSTEKSLNTQLFKIYFFWTTFLGLKKRFFPSQIALLLFVPQLKSFTAKLTWHFFPPADCNWWQKERSGLFPKVAVQFYAAMTSWWSEIDFLPSTHFCLTPYNNRPAVQHQLPGFLIVESCRPGSLQFCCWEGFSWDIPGFPLSCRGWINICCRAARRRECVSLSSRPD